MHVLFIGFRDELFKEVEHALKPFSAETTLTSSGEDVARIFRIFPYDLVIIGFSLDISPMRLAKTLRNMDRFAEIVLIAPDRPKSRRASLPTGIFQVHLPSQKHVLREIAIQVSDIALNFESELKLGRMSVNMDLHQVFVSDVQISLGRREFQLLEQLIRRRGRPLSRWRLLNLMYGQNSPPDVRTIDDLVVSLRKKLALLNSEEGYIDKISDEDYIIAFKNLKRSPTQATRAKSLREETLKPSTRETVLKSAKTALSNKDSIITCSISLKLLIDERIASLRLERPNSPNSIAILKLEIERLSQMRQQIIDISTKIEEFDDTVDHDKAVTSSIVSFKSGLIAWWERSHEEICAKTFDAGLFVSAVGVCALAGATGPLAIAVSGALVGRKPIVDAIRAVGKSLMKRS